MAGTDAANAVRAPFSPWDAGHLKALLDGAGAASVSVTTNHGTACFPEVCTVVGAELRGWLPVMGVHLPGDLVDRIVQEAPAALDAFVTQRGTVEFDVSAHIAVSGGTELP